MRPIKIKWIDGREFEIDKILDVKRAASGAGSGGIRYAVRIRGRTRLLYFEDIYFETATPRWFIDTTNARVNKM